MKRLLGGTHDRREWGLQRGFERGFGRIEVVVEVGWRKRKLIGNGKKWWKDEEKGRKRKKDVEKGEERWVPHPTTKIKFFLLKIKNK